jgi:hypothetical protein
LLNHDPSGVGLERSVRGQSVRERFAAVVDAAYEHEFGLASNQHGALRVAHVEKQKRFLVENFGVSELESIERTDRPELKNVRSHLGFAHRFGDLFHHVAQQTADKIFCFGHYAALHGDVAGFSAVPVCRTTVQSVGMDRGDIEHEILALLVQHG